MSHDDGISNKSANRPFYEVLNARQSRRDVLMGGLGLAATSFFGGTAALASEAVSGSESEFARAFTSTPLMRFTAVPVEGGGGAVPRISPEYQFESLIPWGTPLDPDAGPAYAWPPNSADQAQQIGIGHDGMAFFPLKASNNRGMLAINHEFGRNTHVLGKDAPESLEDVRTSQHAHGVSVVEIFNQGSGWKVIPSGRARRIHVNTEVEFSGPVTDSRLLDNPAGNPYMGTVNNCANGRTPWGTYLTCEENFNGYFGAKGDWTPSENEERYGFSEDGFGYGWHEYDDRFDLSNPDYANEQNRFGWIVEIDPWRADVKPVKRTALGRFKHEGIALTVGRNGRVVGYMGDDERFDYIYKFVSNGNWRTMLARGESPLDKGRLFVAKFNEDGTGNWLHLNIKNPLLREAGFENQQQVLTYARRAADALGATPMDRPEWTTVGPNGDVYCTLTNNSRRETADAANPLAPNADGHIIRWRDADEHIGRTFEWDIFVVAQDRHGQEDTFSDPDGIWADPDGRLFIQTDGGQQDGLNNQMLVADTNTGEIRRIFEGVAGDEITGVAITPDRRTMFINSQHPGNGDPALTNVPAMNDTPDGTTVPRDVTWVLTRKDGGIIGS